MPSRKSSCVTKLGAEAGVVRSTIYELVPNSDVTNNIDAEGYDLSRSPRSPAYRNVVPRMVCVARSPSICVWVVNSVTNGV